MMCQLDLFTSEPIPDSNMAPAGNVWGLLRAALRRRDYVEADRFLGQLPAFLAKWSEESIRRVSEDLLFFPFETGDPDYAFRRLDDFARHIVPMWEDIIHVKLFSWRVLGLQSPALLRVWLAYLQGRQLSCFPVLEAILGTAAPAVFLDIVIREALPNASALDANECIDSLSVTVCPKVRRRRMHKPNLIPRADDYVEMTWPRTLEEIGAAQNILLQHLLEHGLCLRKTCRPGLPCAFHRNRFSFRDTYDRTKGAVIPTLLAAGVDGHHSDDKGHTPLWVALSHDNPDAIPFLLAAGADPSPQFDNPDWFQRYSRRPGLLGPGVNPNCMVKLLESLHWTPSRVESFVLNLCALEASAELDINRAGRVTHPVTYLLNWPRLPDSLRRVIALTHA